MNFLIECLKAVFTAIGEAMACLGAMIMSIWAKAPPSGAKQTMSEWLDHINGKRVIAAGSDPGSSEPNPGSSESGLENPTLRGYYKTLMRIITSHGGYSHCPGRWTFLDGSTLSVVTAQDRITVAACSGGMGEPVVFEEVSIQ